MNYCDKEGRSLARVLKRDRHSRSITVVIVARFFEALLSSSIFEPVGLPHSSNLVSVATNIECRRRVVAEGSIRRPPRP